MTDERRLINQVGQLMMATGMNTVIGYEWPKTVDEAIEWLKYLEDKMRRDDYVAIS